MGVEHNKYPRIYLLVAKVTVVVVNITNESMRN